jgi:hypothetical protein
MGAFWALPSGFLSICAVGPHLDFGAS